MFTTVGAGAEVWKGGGFARISAACNNQSPGAYPGLWLLQTVNR